MYITVKEFVTIRKALELTNKVFDNNITFNRCDFERKSRDGREVYIVTLKCKDSKEAGHRRGYAIGDFETGETKKGRRLISACWHVHGTFFDNLRSLESGCGIKSKGKEYEGRWIDENIGSVMFPLYFSEACDCNEEEDNEVEYAEMKVDKNNKVSKTNVKIIKQSELTSDCWLIQFKGLEACNDCEFKDTEDCGGGETLKKLQSQEVSNG